MMRDKKETETMTMETAQRIAAMLKRNVDLWYADVISLERFGARQATLWALVVKHGVDEQVSELVRPRMVA